MQGTTPSWNWPCMQGTTSNRNWPCMQQLTTQTDHACNNSQPKLTMHASNHSQLKLTMHVAPVNETDHASQLLTTETHNACSCCQLKLTMHATTHNPNSPCTQPHLKLTMQHSTQILNLELTGGQAPFLHTPITPLRTWEESCCLSYHLSNFWPKVSHCSSTNLRVDGCRVNKTNTKKGKAPWKIKIEEEIKDCKSNWQNAKISNFQISVFMHCL